MSEPTMFERITPDEWAKMDRDQRLKVCAREMTLILSGAFMRRYRCRLCGTITHSATEHDVCRAPDEGHVYCGGNLTCLDAPNGGD